MKLSDLSPKSRAVIEKLARKKGKTPFEILKHITDISSGRAVSKHFQTNVLSFSSGV